MSTLSMEEMETRLRAFYASHNPGNEQNIEEIARKYRGKEAVLCAKLKKKYGVAPELLATASDPAPKAPTSAPNASISTPLVYDPAYTVLRVEASTGGVLDFRSTSFDALRALQSRVAVPLVKGLTPLDNIHKCRHLLPSSDPNHQKLVIPTAKKPTPSKVVGSDANANANTSTPIPPAQRVPALFEALADTYLDGPFTVLRRCFLERRRVRVVIRRVNSVRGTCTGYLKAFDKHMNMVLIDVQEELVPHKIHEQRDIDQARRKRDGGRDAGEIALFSVADENRNRQITTTRYAKQLFVRGDNVVMAMEAPAAQQPSLSQSKQSTPTNRSSRNYAPRR